MNAPPTTTRSPVSDDDVALARSIAGGDRASEARLVQRFEAGLLAIARVRAGREVAADVVQDTFAAAIQNLRRGAWKADGPLAAYLAAILRRRIHRSVGDGHVRIATERDDPVALAADPLRVAQAAEARERLRRAVRELPVHLEQVVVGHYFDERPVEEVAARLGIPRGTVLSRLHAARRRIHAAIGSSRRGSRAAQGRER